METLAAQLRGEEFNPLNMCQILIKEESEANTSDSGRPATYQKSLTQLRSLQHDSSPLPPKGELYDYPPPKPLNDLFPPKQSFVYSPNERPLPNAFPGAFPPGYRPLKAEYGRCPLPGGLSPPVYPPNNPYQPIKAEFESYPSGALEFGHQWSHFGRHEAKGEPYPSSSQAINGTHTPGDRKPAPKPCELAPPTTEEAPPRPFPCDTCDLTFSKRACLKKHQGAHARERNLVCAHCALKFDDRGAYESHLVAHTGVVKPYECRACKRRFGRKNHLSRHAFTHTGERPFACSECRERFTRREHLERHRLLHTGELPYGCPHCKARFRRKTYLKSHRCANTNRNAPPGCDNPTENQLAPEAYL